MAKPWDFYYSHRLFCTAHHIRGTIPVPFFFRRFHAARLLLFMETGPGLAPCGFGCPDRSRLLLHSHYPDLFHTQEARSAVQLDVLVLWNVHHGLWHHARHGSVDTLAWYVLALWCDQSCHCYCFGPHSYIARPFSSSGARAPQPGSNEA